MADYNLKAEITADASGYEAGIKKAEKASKKLSTTISGVVKGLGKNGLVGALGSVGLASMGLTATLGAVVKIARQVSKTINECTEAYRKQVIAEKQLSIAVENNPLVSADSIRALKNYASELQSITNYGDEELLPMMANLVSLGRTEAETMQIMSVAMDMSAGMGISLDTAITQLNATLNGNIGRLGQQNAELKNLTEEELKAGKAVEILGRKYKGMAENSVDTSKQLKNAIGDYKELLGATFNDAVKPMEQFFAKLITNINNAKKETLDYKNALKNTFDEAGNIKETSKLEDLQIVWERNKKELSEMRDRLRELKADTSDMSFLAQDSINTLIEEIGKLQAETNKVQKRILKLQEEEKQKNAETKAEQEQIEREKELAELRKKEAEERAKALEVQKEWQEKLFDIRLENLEKARERELENEELTQEEKLSINEFYANQILTLKLKQIEKERNEILADEKLTEEARQSVILFYENKIAQVKQAEADRVVDIKKKADKEEIKSEEKKADEIVNIALEMTIKIKEATKSIAETFKTVAKKVISTMKDAFSKIGNVFTKLFAFNTNDALDNLLKFEDSVLTFFVETLPKLPAFLKSAVQSIIVLIDDLLSSIDWDMITDVINSIIDTIVKNAPKIVENLLQVVLNIAQALVDGLINFVKSGGWKTFLNLLLTIQKKLEQFVIENINDIVNTIIDMLPDLVNMLIESIVSASKTLGKIIGPVIKLILAVIEAIIKVLFSEEVIDASLDAVMELLEIITTEAVPEIVRLIIRVIPQIIKALIKNLPKLIKTFATSIGQSFRALGEIFYAVWDEIFSNPYLWQVLNGIGDNIKNFFKSIGDGIYNFFNGVFEWVNGVWTNLLSGAEWAINGIKGFFTGLADNVKSVFESIGNGIKWAINGIIDVVNNAINGINYVVGWTGIKVPNIPRLAKGTDNAKKGLTLVGEAGPELVRFNGGEQVLNNRNTNKALAEAGKSTNNFNVTFNNLQDTTAYAMMQQLKQYNRQMSINGVI